VKLLYLIQRSIVLQYLEAFTKILPFLSHLSPASDSLTSSQLTHPVQLIKYDPTFGLRRQLRHRLTLIVRTLYIRSLIQQEANQPHSSSTQRKRLAGSHEASLSSQDCCLSQDHLAPVCHQRGLHEPAIAPPIPTSIMPTLSQRRPAIHIVRITIGATPE